MARRICSNYKTEVERSVFENSEDMFLYYYVDITYALERRTGTTEFHLYRQLTAIFWTRDRDDGGSYVYFLIDYSGFSVFPLCLCLLSNKRYIIEYASVLHVPIQFLSHRFSSSLF